MKRIVSKTIISDRKNISARLLNIRKKKRNKALLMRRNVKSFNLILIKLRKVQMTLVNDWTSSTIAITVLR